MTKKQLNTQSIQNELAGASVFFRRPAAQQAPRQPQSAQNGSPAPAAVSQVPPKKKQPPRGRTDQESAGNETTAGTEGQKDVGLAKPDGRTRGTHVRTADLIDQVLPAPAKRRPERYAFQFWADQITRLKKLKYVLNIAKDPEDREEITLSDMVRQAMDDYLAQQTKRIRQRERTDDSGVRPYGQKP